MYFSWDGIPAEQGVVFTRTYTVAPNGQPGTLGQEAHGQLLTTLPAAGVSQVVPLALDALTFRSNVSIANLGSANTVTVRVRNTQGVVVGEKAYRCQGTPSFPQVGDTQIAAPCLPGVSLLWEG